MTTHVCVPCQRNDHTNHQPTLGGVCVGCTCEEGGWQDGTVKVTVATYGPPDRRRDRGSHTEADAGAFEAAHTYRPTRLEDAIDRGYDPHEWQEGDR